MLNAQTVHFYRLNMVQKETVADNSRNH